MEPITDEFYQNILNDWARLGLLKEDGKPITKKAFLENMRIHTYGRGQGKLFIGIVGNHPKDGIYGFYPRFVGETKKDFKDKSYKAYCAFIINEAKWIFEDGRIQYGNKGVPIAFGDLRQH